MKSAMKFRKRKGGAYLLVIAVFLFVSLISTLMLSTISQSVYQTHVYGMQMQSYYLTNQAADATVAVLLADDNLLLNSMSYPQTDTMIHTDESGTVLGSSQIRLAKERHDYYGDNKEWIVAYIETKIPDQRGSREGEDFSYKGSVMILVENPLIQLYNINPDNF